MKVIRVGLWSVWLYGFVLICFSLYTTQRLPPFKDEIQRTSNFNHNGFSHVRNPRITIFSAPVPFAGSAGARQSLAIRSWLALSSQITVILFTQEPSAVSFASAFDSRVLIDHSVDFTFLGTPFFHSMMERSLAFSTDISVFINPETILLPDFVCTLNYAYKLDHDWLLVASSQNVSYFPFHLDDSGKHWLRKDGKWIKPQELQEMLTQKWLGNHCDDRMLMAWNSKNVPLHNGVLPPFLYGKGIHNHWVINEAVLSDFRFVFDASSTISSFYLNDEEHKSEKTSSFSDAKNRSWENVGNSHLGATYGLLSFHEINYSSIVKLVKCDGHYLFVDLTEDITYPFMDQGLNLWNRRILHSRRKKKTVACVNHIKSQERVLNCSLRDQLKELAPLEFPFSLEPLLSGTADENKTVVLAVAGYSYKDMLMSWVCRLRHLQVTNFLICALDHETYEFSVLQGLPVFHDPSAPSNISFDDCHFGTKCFQRVTKMKSRMVLKILKLGYNVLLSDVDVYWFTNPLPVLRSFGPAVLVAQSDEYNKAGPVNLPRRLNSGFYFAHSDGSTIAALEKVVKHATISGLSEQPSFYDTLCGEGGSNRIGDDRCVEPETNLTVHFLDRNLFPNGAYLDLWQKKNVKNACAKKGCLILHNNWISGRLKKLERQVLSGLWEYDSSKRLCCRGCKAFIHFLGRIQGSHKESGKEIGKSPLSLDMCSQSKDISVRIVHAGGREELYQHAVPASHLMEKYPGMCVARPEVFRNPQESLLWPDENLLPGHKYLLIPSTTAQKLKRKQMEKTKVADYAGSKNEMSDVNITWEAGKDITEESVSSAKEFYTSKGRWSRDSKSSAKRSFRARKPFVPPLPKSRILRGPGWEPSLTSVQELSP